MIQLLSKLRVRSLLAFSAMCGAYYLAIVDESYRASFHDMAMLVLGAYFGQMVPGKVRQTSSAPD